MAPFYLFFSSFNFLQILFSCYFFLPKWVSGTLIDWFIRKLTVTTKVKSFCDSRDFFSFRSFSRISLSSSLFRCVCVFSLGTSFSICREVNWYWEVHFFLSLRMTGCSHTTCIIYEDDWEEEKTKEKEKMNEEEKDDEDYDHLLVHTFAFPFLNISSWWNVFSFLTLSLPLKGSGKADVQSTESSIQWVKSLLSTFAMIGHKYCY